MPVTQAPGGLRSLTCHGALAGIPARGSADSVGRGGDLVTAVFDDDGVAAHLVRHVGHLVGAVIVVMDTGLLRLAVLVLEGSRAESCYGTLLGEMLPREWHKGTSRRVC